MPERKWERAVSPVVGVMLMLVVTIIIAAIVSAFAGNALEGTDQAPQATIQGICYVNSSQQNLVVLTHMGGDSLVPSRTEVVIKKGDGMGVIHWDIEWLYNNKYQRQKSVIPMANYGLMLQAVVPRC